MSCGHRTMTLFFSPRLSRIWKEIGCRFSCGNFLSHVSVKEKKGPGTKESTLLFLEGEPFSHSCAELGGVGLFWDPPPSFQGIVEHCVRFCADLAFLGKFHSFGDNFDRIREKPPRGVQIGKFVQVRAISCKFVQVRASSCQVDFGVFRAFFCPFGVQRASSCKFVQVRASSCKFVQEA